MDLGYGSGSGGRDLRVSALEGELIKYRDMRTVLTFQLLNGECIDGSVRLYDGLAVGVLRPDRSEVTLFYHSISFYVPKKLSE